LAKNGLEIVMIGSLISGTYFDFQRRAIEPREWVPRHPGGPGIFDHLFIGEPDMPKAVRVSAHIAGSTASSEKSESHPLVSIALFSGIGLLISLVVVLLGVSGVWD
jgi:hypothetical protein